MQPIFSKLHNDELLFIEKFHGEPLVISKEDFLLSDEWADYPYNIRSVSIADFEIIQFDLKDIIDQLGEYAYEDWNEQVWDSIENAPETKAFLELVKKTFECHKVYYPSKAILIDINTKDVKI